MTVIERRALQGERVEREHPLLQLGLFCAVGIYISILLSYGVDLSPGLF